MSIDPRANSPERLVAPAPLPHVSRRALQRVKDALPAPTCCRYCDGKVELVNNSKIYNGRSYGDWPYAYLCSDCDAYVGLHPDTDVPLGTLADGGLRGARNKSKALFHKVKERRGLSRSLAYQWLAGQLGMPVSECHFGWFEANQCARVIEVCNRDLAQATGMQQAFHQARVLRS